MEVHVEGRPGSLQVHQDVDIIEQATSKPIQI